MTTTEMNNKKVKDLTIKEPLLKRGLKPKKRGSA